MFERTALSQGPARHQRPTARRPIRLDRRLRARRVPPRAPRTGRRRALHGAPDVQGHRRASRLARDLGGDRGGRRQLQRRHRPRVDGLLGPRAAAREAKRDGRPGRADRPAHAAGAEIEGRSGRDRRGDPLLSRRPGRVRPRCCSSRRCSATARSGREICGDEAGIRCRRATRSASSGARRTGPANTVVAVGRATSSHETPSHSSTAAFGPGNGAIPALRSGARAPGRRARDDRPARHVAGAAVARGARAFGATTRTRGPSRCSTRCWATG